MVVLLFNVQFSYKKNYKDEKLNGLFDNGSMKMVPVSSFFVFYNIKSHVLLVFSNLIIGQKQT